MLYDNLLQTIGNTPLIRLNNITAKDGKSRIYVKAEFMNPAGSIKDRTAFFMLNEAEKKSLINKGTVIIEPTSGNTGIGLAMFCAVRKLKLILTMPENMSQERVRTLRAYGAEIVLTDKNKGMAGAIEEAERLKKVYPDSFIPSQFDNSDNLKAHYETTAKEIVRDLPSVKAVVAGVGTGGTLCGIAKYFKDNKVGAKIIAVEPYSSAVLSGEQKGVHNLQGIGAGFIPEIVDKTLFDQIVKVKEEDAYNFARKLAKEEGIFTGITSGASLYAGIEISRKIEGDIVVILPDTGARYLSTELYE